MSRVRIPSPAFNCLDRGPLSKAIRYCYIIAKTSGFSVGKCICTRPTRDIDHNALQHANLLELLALLWGGLWVVCAYFSVLPTSLFVLIQESWGMLDRLP